MPETPPRGTPVEMKLQDPQMGGVYHKAALSTGIRGPKNQLAVTFNLEEGGGLFVRAWRYPGEKEWRE